MYLFNPTVKNNLEYTLISLHNYPNSTPISGSDLLSTSKRKYKKGVIVCHNGDVYIYKAGKIPFTAGIFDRTVDKYKITI